MKNIKKASAAAVLTAALAAGTAISSFAAPDIQSITDIRANIPEDLEGVEIDIPEDAFESIRKIIKGIKKEEVSSKKDAEVDEEDEKPDEKPNKKPSEKPDEAPEKPEGEEEIEAPEKPDRKPAEKPDEAPEKPEDEPEERPEREPLPEPDEDEEIPERAPDKVPEKPAKVNPEEDELTILPVEEPDEAPVRDAGYTGSGAAVEGRHSQIQPR